MLSPSPPLCRQPPAAKRPLVSARCASPFHTFASCSLTVTAMRALLLVLVVAAVPTFAQSAETDSTAGPSRFSLRAHTGLVVAESGLTAGFAGLTGAYEFVPGTAATFSATGGDLGAGRAVFASFGPGLEHSRALDDRSELAAVVGLRFTGVAVAVRQPPVPRDASVRRRGSGPGFQGRRVCRDRPDRRRLRRGRPLGRGGERLWRLARRPLFQCGPPRGCPRPVLGVRQDHRASAGRAGRGVRVGPAPTSGVRGAV